MKKFIINSFFQILIVVFLFQSNLFAGEAKLFWVHDSKTKGVNKYEFRYGLEKIEDPSLYSKFTIIDPQEPIFEQFSCNVKFDGVGPFYVSVKYIYTDGTESDYSDPVLINKIPAKISKPVIVN